MKVLAADILAKIPDLPADFREHVYLNPDIATAEVRSFTEPEPGAEWTIYETSIHRGVEEGELIAKCSCPARTLCKHIVSHYAVAKQDTPEVAPLLPRQSEGPIAAPPPVEGGRKAGLAKIAESQRLRAQADELLTDGIALIVRAESKEA